MVSIDFIAYPIILYDINGAQKVTVSVHCR